MNAETPISDLVQIEAKDAFAIFTTNDPRTALAPTLDRLSEIVAAWEPLDVTTPKGRENIASRAYRITKVKTAIEGIGEKLAADAKKVPGLIDATRRYAKTTLDALRDEVRKPLTEWEAAENIRLAKHRETLARLNVLATATAALPVPNLRNALATVEAVDASACEEFEGEISIAKGNALSVIRLALVARERAEAEAEELAKLRAEKAERDRLDREADIAAEAAAAATRREREAAEARERKLRADKEAAEQHAVETAARVKAEMEAQKRAEIEEQERRERNVAHKRKVNKAAVADLVAGGISEETAKAVVTLIAKGAVSGISIRY